MGTQIHCSKWTQTRFAPARRAAAALRCLHGKTRTEQRIVDRLLIRTNCAPPRFEVLGLRNRLQIRLTAKVSKLKGSYPKGVKRGTQ